MTSISNNKQRSTPGFENSTSEQQKILINKPSDKRPMFRVYEKLQHSKQRNKSKQPS